MQGEVGEGEAGFLVRKGLWAKFGSLDCKVGFTVEQEHVASLHGTGSRTPRHF